MGAGGRTSHGRRRMPIRAVQSDLRRAKARRALRLALGEHLVRIAAAAGGGVDREALQAKSRCIRPVAETRQLGMYLAHTLFSASLTRTGLLFGRDRTTVRHACQCIELRRERGTLARVLKRLEPALAEWAGRFAEIGLPDEEPT